MCTTSTTSEKGHNGRDSSVENDIRDLARRAFTNASSITYPMTGGDTSSLNSKSPINPVFTNCESHEYTPKLDPNSDEFSSTEWVRNLSKLIRNAPEHYKPYTLGCLWRSLRAFGSSGDVTYQSTVANIPKKLCEFVYRKCHKANEDNTIDILKPMDGLIEPGELLVVLGRPGSGCTTLLKSISSNTHGFHLDSNSVIEYDGMSPEEIKKHYRGEVVYNAEADVHFPHLTVFETLNTIALLSTPSNRIPGVSRVAFAKHLTEVAMATYGLLHTRNTKVGNELVRGVSGGERKRVSIAEVSICGSKLQCWDNATRGLDSATAMEFVKALRASARMMKSSSAVAIYQCSQETYDLFDKVCVLYEGRQIYFGSANEAKQYFEELGYICPERQTTADFITAVTSPGERIANENKKFVPSTAEEMEKYWKNSENYRQLLGRIEEHQNQDNSGQNTGLRKGHVARQSYRARASSPFIVSYWLQVKYLLVRNFQRIRNSIGLTLFLVLGNSSMSLLLGSMFYKVLKHDNTAGLYSRAAALFFAVLFNAFSCMLEVLALYESRPIIEKHKRYSLYHPSADALASIISEIPSKLVTAVFFNIVFYFLCNFKTNAGAFFFYFMMSLIATFVMSHIFRCIGSATKTLAQAMVPGSVLLLAMSIYTGFAIPKTKILRWSKWIWYINPLAYIFESMMVNEFHDHKFECSEYIPRGPGYQSISGTERVCSSIGAKPGENFVDGELYINASYDYYHDHKWRGFGIGLAYAIFFLGLYLVITEFNESAKQKGEILVFRQPTFKKKIKKVRSASDLESSGGAASASEKNLVGDCRDDSLDSIGQIELSKSEAIFHWKNVCYDVVVKGETRRILSGIDGWVKPGTLTALMGASGAGKTTLLDCLAARVTSGVITGDIFVNGHLRDSSFARSIGYCQQQDLHLETATVRESLRFAAYLRQPRSVSIENKNRYVESVINILEMTQYADAIVGVSGEGLNVEQRKRLTIGVELAAKPKLLIFLDEPTSGLDSQTAWSICQLIRKLADNGQAVLCTIHQPSALLLQEFDRLLFLQRGGQTVYFGDLGERCQTMIDYFEKNGAHQCPKDVNPAEWMLEVIGAAPGSHADQDYHEVWKASKECKATQAELEWMEKELVKKSQDNFERGEFASSLLFQYFFVTKRLFQQYWRTPSYLWSKATLTLFSQIFIGFTFFKADRSLQGLQNQMLSVFMFTVVFNPTVQQYLPTYISQRDLYEARERPSKTFSWIAFILSQITVEIPWNFTIGTLGFSCYYYPVSFYRNASFANQLHERGALFWLFCTAFYVFTGSMAQLCVASQEVAQSAGHIASLLFVLSLSFCGVMVTPNNMPGFWKFMYRVSPLTYFIDGVLSTGIANSKVECSDYEFVTFTPRSGQNCGEYMALYIDAAGTGYIKDSGATVKCSFCPASSTNAFLKMVSSNYSHRWRNYGIFLCYICFNIFASVFLYWLARVPKRKAGS